VKSWAGGGLFRHRHRSTPESRRGHRREVGGVRVHAALCRSPECPAATET
jgi:hypothetical protein